MKSSVLMRAALVIGGFAGLVVAGWIILWLANGGWPASGPTGDVLPPHILRVRPADGDIVIDIRNFCVDFSFQEGNGMGFDPNEKVRYFLDGRNITTEVHGFITLNYPPFGGSLCYNSDTPLSPGWHTVKVAYNDIMKQKFEYAWRFQVMSAQ